MAIAPSHIRAAANLVPPGTHLQLNHLPTCSVRRCKEPAHLSVPSLKLEGDADLTRAALTARPMCWRHFRGKDYRDPALQPREHV